jgi:hypothetical protein
MQLLAPALHLALVGELAQHALQDGAIGIFEIECARDFARTNFSRLLGNESDEILLGGEGCFTVVGSQWPIRKKTHGG